MKQIIMYLRISKEDEDIKPDRIRLYITKEDIYEIYEKTLRMSAEDTELLKDLFEKFGFQRKELKTVYFNVDTEYESFQDKDKSWKRRFKGYKYMDIYGNQKGVC